MKICVDTTILIDILKDEFRSFQEKLYIALEEKVAMVSPPVVFAELLPQFDGNADLAKEFLNDHKITIEPLETDAAAASALAWMKYLKRKEKIKCPHCNRWLKLKLHVLSDFYIGGFASVKCDAILTRDRGIYTKYFPLLVGYKDCLRQ
ncbi:MAG: hypothetical protein JEZ11_12895 [Desulfobacterales bacterium]|nr:hypothetical protein [Desulfobacterales bacterium]